MTTTMENIRDMIDVNTVVGDPVESGDGSTIIPISRVSFGFVAGGGEYAVPGSNTRDGKLPFAGGTGAGVSVHPMGFLILSQGQVRLLPAQYYAPVDRIIEMVPDVLCEIKQLIKQKCGEMKSADKDGEKCGCGKGGKSGGKANGKTDPAMPNDSDSSGAATARRRGLNGDDRESAVATDNDITADFQSPSTTGMYVTPMNVPCEVCDESDRNGHPATDGSFEDKKDKKDKKN